MRPPLSRLAFLAFDQGASHRLDICTPSGDKQDPELASPEARGDLDTEEEDDVTAQMRQYEETIGDLMTDIGALKSEVRSLPDASSIASLNCFVVSL